MRKPLPFPFVIGHRGSPRTAPENTLASFRQAARDGATWVEFDVSLTSDGRAVIFHDDDLDRTSDGTGPLAATPFDALRNLDAGGWFSPSFAGEPIPTLEEALELFRELGLSFNMEIKPDRGREVETAEVALAIARDCWPSDLPAPLISSFSRASVATAKEVQPGWPRGLLFDRVTEDWKDVGAQLDVISFGANHQHLTAETIRTMHEAGYGVMAYTVNDTERARTLKNWGVDGIFTDIPAAMLKAFT
ncbi:MAG: glycerophosphodiester phosphodiesterase [Rhodospirillaceae bacterium]|nr:glycerophosphodiester phosphodiesterase [Rhodospirillaceae bacterium]